MMSKYELYYQTALAQYQRQLRSVRGHEPSSLQPASSSPPSGASIYASRYCSAIICLRCRTPPSPDAELPNALPAHLLDASSRARSASSNMIRSAS